MRRRLSAAMVGSIVLLIAFVPATFAECMNIPLGANERPRIAFAFIAVTDDVERREAFEPGSDLFRYRVTLATERVYRGRVQDTVELTGSNWDCSFLGVSNFAVGERLFIASERLSSGPDWTDVGNVLVWRHTGSGWRFYEDALVWGSDAAYYPKAARTATTTADIVQLLSAAPMPDTSTDPQVRERPRGEAFPGLALLFVVAFVAGTRLSSPARRRRCRTGSL